MTAQPDSPIWATAEKPVLSADWSADGNAFWLLGSAKKAQRKAGWTPEQSDAWYAEATSGDYDHVIQTILAWHEQPDG